MLCNFEAVRQTIVISCTSLLYTLLVRLGCSKPVMVGIHRHIINASVRFCQGGVGHPIGFKGGFDSDTYWVFYSVRSVLRTGIGLHGMVDWRTENSVRRMHGWASFFFLSCLFPFWVPWCPGLSAGFGGCEEALRTLNPSLHGPGSSWDLLPFSTTYCIRTPSNVRMRSYHHSCLKRWSST